MYISNILLFHTSTAIHLGQYLLVLRLNESLASKSQKLENGNISLARHSDFLTFSLNL